MREIHRHKWTIRITEKKKKQDAFFFDGTPRHYICACGARMVGVGLSALYFRKGKKKPSPRKYLKSPVGMLAVGSRKLFESPNSTFSKEQQHGIADFFTAMLLMRFKVDNLAATELLVNGITNFIGKDKIAKMIKEMPSKDHAKENQNNS